MCRFVAYLGPVLTLDALLTHPRNSLIHQSFKSEERKEPLNGDGFGVAWYAPEVSPDPAAFRSITPAWSNCNLMDLARVTRTGCAFAHVRAASPGLAVTETNCHPFRAGGLTFMHNGYLAGFHEVRRKLLRSLSNRAFRAIGGTTDSEHLFALFLDRYWQFGDEDGSESGVERLRQALAKTIDDAIALTEDAEIKRVSQLNLAVTDGKAMAVARFTTDSEGLANSLYVHTGRRYVCDGDECRMVQPDEEGAAVLVSSERLSDDEGWDRVPVNHLVCVASDRTVTLTPITVQAS